jgi:hypothetical protein
MGRQPSMTYRRNRQPSVTSGSEHGVNLALQYLRLRSFDIESRRFELPRLNCLQAPIGNNGLL